MRIIFTIISLFAFSVGVFAQNTAGKADDAGRIALNAVVPEDMGDMTEKAREVLVSKLNKLVTKYGTGGSALNQRFIITAKVLELEKTISATTPPIYNYTLECVLYIGDGIEGTLFSSTSVELNGAGKSETKAYLSALKQIKYSSKKYKDFLDEGKTKILEYYNGNCDIIIKKATTLGDQKEYDEAIMTLVSIPSVCKECYDKAMDQSTVIFKAKLENECQENIGFAKASIAQNNYDEAASFLAGYTPELACYSQIESMLTDIKDHRCADNLGKAKGAWANRDSRKASQFLAQVSTDSKCAAEANQLSIEIASKLDANEKKEWDLKLQKQKDATMLKKSSINAMKAIGVAYGNNQPKTITKYTTVVRGWY